MRGGDTARIQVASDIGEALAGSVLGADALDELGRKDWRASARARGLLPSPGRTTPLGGEALELVGGDELGSPGKLDLRDVGEEALEGRLANAERVGGFRAGVGETLDPFRFAHDDARLALGVAELLLDPATKTATRHAYTIHEP
jgi:hypothetical protein